MTAHQQFFSRLSYSFGNEDWQVERKALRIKPKDRVICITASGDRPLNLLMDPCAELISVDLNETQNFLLSLKVNAMRHMAFPEYLSFLGATDCNQRIQNLKVLLPKLDRRSRNFWGKNQKLIDQGILYQGAVEKMLKKWAYLLKLIRGSKIDRLFEFTDLSKQQAFVNEEWNSYLWQKALQFIFKSNLVRYLLKDPGLTNLGTSITPFNYISGRFTDILNRGLAKQNPLVSLVLRGYVGKEAFPPYLTEEGHSQIISRLDKLSWKQGNYITYLENSPPNSFDCFSVSDIASYMSENDFIRLLKAIQRTARPGARFSIRQFMSDHPMPEKLRSYFCRNADFEKELEREERCFVYRFMAGTIKK